MENSSPGEHKFCGFCGARVSAKARFCGSCGHKLPEAPTTGTVSDNTSDTVIGHLNSYFGNTGTSTLNWKHLFSDVFRSHSFDDAENIFICGTKTTTPSPETVSATWPRPWLYSRVFVAMMAAFLLLYICCAYFSNQLAYPGLLIVGAFTVPIVTVILFLEVNAFRNISFHKVLGIVMIGGCASLVATLFLFDLDLVDSELGTLWGGMMVGLIEETGKAVIVYLVIKRLNIGFNILPALLVGASVGAGFAAFESAGYAFLPLYYHVHDIACYSAAQGTPYMLDFPTVLEASMDNILLRGYLAPGGHVAWAAISGAAIVIAAKAQGHLSSDVFKSKAFWRIFIIPVILHGLWDTPFIEGISWHIMLVVSVWVVVLILIDMGLKQATPDKNLTLQAS